MHFNVMPFGDTGVHIQLGEKISPETNRWIRGFATLLEQEQIPGIVEWIPTYTAISIVYDPYIVAYHELQDHMYRLKKQLHQVPLPPARVVHVPTCYGRDKGPDLARVAKHNGLKEERVVSIHAAPLYLIYMLGFTPGFPYLGGMSAQIATPRLSEPRARVPAGSVGIAGKQTGIYTLPTPGGWQLIGQTPLRLYDPYRDPPILLKAGNYLKFVPISAEEFEHIEQQVKQGTYEPYMESLEKEGEGRGEVHDTSG